MNQLTFLCKGGNGLNGRLGHGDEENRTTPTLVGALEDIPIRAIACGAGHMAAISSTANLTSASIAVQS
jgi:alpha-tubulin suppressor-like RCC1 family protein